MEFTHANHDGIKLRVRYAWWPVEVWGTDKMLTGVEFKNMYYWKKDIIEMKTISHGWRAYQRYQYLLKEMDPTQ